MSKSKTIKAIIVFHIPILLALFTLLEISIVLLCIAQIHSKFMLAVKFFAFFSAILIIIVALFVHIKKENEEKFRIALESQLFDLMLEAVIMTDAEGTILSANKAFETLSGWPRDELIGKKPRIFRSDKHDDAFFKNMWKCLLNNGAWTDNIWNRKRDGTIWHEHLAIRAIKSKNNITKGYIAVCMAPQQNTQNIDFINIDALTGLPNRTLLYDRLDIATKQAQRNQELVAILYIDLDRFKYINTSYSYALGDSVLQACAKRLVDSIRQTDTAARLSADNFVVLIPSLKREEDGVLLAGKIMTSLRQPYYIDSKELYIDASVGIAFFPTDGTEPDNLIGSANSALSHAKENGAGSLRIYTPSLNERITRRLALDSQLRHAVESESFIVHYQPRINAKTRIVEGMEALVRWVEPDGNIIFPSEFIPLAEDTGLIVQIGEIVLKKALADLHRWLKIDPALKLSVNLSRQQFKLPDLVSRINKALSEAEINHSSLELEITETLAMSDVVRSASIMTTFNKHGVRFSLDDFGTGYSSLYYLKNLPIQWLKIDKSFVQDIRNPDDSPANAIVKTILEMAKNLGLQTIAEGCETEEQYGFLSRHNCDQIQGFLFSEPVESVKFEKLIGKAL